jgi:hypothetical protein
MNYTDWMLKTIRQDSSLGGWLEEIRFIIAPIFQDILKNIENGVSVIILTDENRQWFSQYIISKINNNTDRPLFPFTKLESFINNTSLLNSKEHISLVEDMLSIAFPNGYIFWYIGKSNTNISTIAKNKNRSFLWLMDEELPNSVYLSSNDPLIDFKLLQLFSLFDKSISATIYGEFQLTK